MSNFAKPNIFMSACIEFDACRYDGELITNDYIKKLLPYVNVTRVCPELAIGLGSPRDAIRLVQRKGETLKLLSSKEGVDHTEKMIDFTGRYLSNLKKKEIDGFILTAKSPTCGVYNVKIYRDIGKANVISAKNPGMFGKAVLENFPTSPVETERRLSNYNIRDRFFTEIFTLATLRDISKEFKMKELVRFHSENKYLFMSYNQHLLRQLGQIVANHEKLDKEIVLSNYKDKLQILFKSEPTKKKRINVLEHIYGYFKNDIDKSEKDYYFEVQNEYLNNHIPYSNVLTVLKGWAIRFKQDYLIQQRIFEPYPKELITVIDSGKKI